MATLSLTPLVINNYEQLFDTCIINNDKYAEVDAGVARIVANKDRYAGVSDPLNIPWYVVGIIHSMECDCDFTTHLFNGDPLTARTVNDPAGMPQDGDPPFTWEDSATAALKYDGLDVWTDWSIPGTLYQFEKFNGYGYHFVNPAVNSPYLWSYSNQYTSGKFVADHDYDPNAVSQQCGAAVLLRRMCEQQIVIVGQTDRITQIKQVGPQVAYNPGPYTADTYSDSAKQLQALISSVGTPLKIDGYAGQNTSTAYYQITGTYLNGDPRIQS